MGRKPLFMALCCAASLGIAGALEASDIVRDTFGARETINCDGRSVSINSASGVFTLLGQCPSVHVNGVSNKVSVEIAGRITVDGTANEVVWSRAARGDPPKIRDNGVNNTIRQGSVGQRRPQTASVEDGSDASVRQNDGNGAIVRTTGVGSVGVDANGRVVIHSETTGDTMTAGHGSVVAKGGTTGTAATMEPGRITAGDGGVAGREIVINDDHVVRRIRCDEPTHVVVNGDGCDLTLEGGCMSLSVQGEDNRVRVQGPIAAIGLLGEGNTVTWSADDNPRPPKVSNVGTNNVARPSSR